MININMKNINTCIGGYNMHILAVDTTDKERFAKLIDELVGECTDKYIAKQVYDDLVKYIGAEIRRRPYIGELHDMMCEKQQGGNPIVLINDNIYELYIEMPGGGPCAAFGQTMIESMVEILKDTNTTWFIHDNTLTVVAEDGG